MAKYDLCGVKAAISKLVERALVIRVKRQAEDTAREASPITFSLIDGSKKD